ncbi:hypothetical protein CRE_18244 [Caenorhabditis remanei]|uniref:Uncharacterized protein n=1 Tax=Caenorhabditis remanei TaxID=31234 RepID=E3NFG6_CAERE|nr:hypothetical protein CRE_18244 [Caenorhabditis remanei]
MVEEAGDMNVRITMGARSVSQRTREINDNDNRKRRIRTRRFDSETDREF